MPWTKTPPTKPGTYGYRGGPTWPPFILLVDYDCEELWWINPATGRRGRVVFMLEKHVDAEWWDEPLKLPWEKKT